MRPSCPCWAPLLAIVLLLFPALAAAQNGAIPLTVADDSAGDWVVSRYAGNSTAGYALTQGPAREVGGLGAPSSMAFAPDGRVFMAVGAVVEVSADGILRLALGGEGSEAAGAPEDVYGGDVAWHPLEERLFLGGRGCLRRLVEAADGGRRVEVVVGDPKAAAHIDGPAGVARLGSVYNVLINAVGTVFFFDLLGTEQSLRMYRGGVVTTLVKQVRYSGWADGPLASAGFNLIGLGGMLSLGEGDDVLYVGDHWNFNLRRIDVAAKQVTTVMGLRLDPKGPTPQDDRYNRNADGPALTHASCNSGCALATYDPVHRAVWTGGPDEGSFRWLRLSDGWVKTVIGLAGRDDWNREGTGVPAATVKLLWNRVAGVDPQGRAYLITNDGSWRNGVWRASNAREVAP